jgi:hypothetical protein
VTASAAEVPFLHLPRAREPGFSILYTNNHLKSWTRCASLNSALRNEMKGYEMKRDDRGLTNVASAPAGSGPFAVVGARSAAADARQTSLAFPRHSAGRRVRNGLESPIFYRSSQIRAVRSPFTRHTMPSNFHANSLKTNKSGTAYSTHNSRGREPRFRTLNFIDPPKFQQEQVN